MAAFAGADFAIFDMEHTGWDAGSVRAALATARGTSLLSIVRVVRPRYDLIATALDAGAAGVMSPMIETEAEARELVSAAKYPPMGRRGFGLLYGDDFVEKPATAVERINRRTFVIAQIESATGVANIDAIAAVDGIDLLWLGQYDLSSSLGIAGKFEDAEYLEAVETVLEAARRHGKPLGQMVSSVEEAEGLAAHGFGVFAYSDIWLFENALRQIAEETRVAVRKARKGIVSIGS